MINNKVYMQVNSKLYTNFTSITYTKSFENLSGGFEIKVADNKNDVLPMQRGDFISIFVNDELVKSGYIMQISGSKNKGNRDITFKGYDKSIDLVQSTLVSGMEIINSINLVDIFKRVFANVGLDLTVSTNVDIADFTEEQVFSGDVGESAFKFLSKYCEKAQVFMNSDADGNIILTQSGSEESDLTIYSAYNDTDQQNNVISSGYEVNDEKLFNKYIMRGQGTFIGDELSLDFDGLDGQAVDDTIRVGRVLEVVVDTTDTAEVLANKCQWKMNVSRGRAERYEATLPNLLTSVVPNSLTYVKDDSWGLNKQMLIVDVSYTYTDAGSYTNVTTTDPRAYQPLNTINDTSAVDTATNSGEVFN